jgi:3-hydroxyisobutyrate dehydrogenase-like beta-hydroxyacid dehydrogenase
MSVRESQPVVGFIGLGDQGLPIATAIAKAGYQLHVWDRRPQAADNLREVPHFRHESSGELAASCDVVALCVPSDEDAIDVVRRGLLDQLRPGAVVINHGTGMPANACRLSEICAPGGVDVLDAPVSGGRLAAEERRSTTMVGGPEPTARRCEPLFRSFCRHVFYLGGSGSGQTAKLFNNTLLMMNQANIAEVVELAASYGADVTTLVEVFKASSANSTALELLNTMITVDTVDHLVAVQLLDMDIFARAMSDRGVSAELATSRAIEGTNNLHGLLHRLNA